MFKCGIFSGPYFPVFGLNTGHFLTQCLRKAPEVSCPDFIKTKYPNMRLTFEIGDQTSFSFLDMKINRNTNKKPFETSIFRKSTLSAAFTNFKSFIAIIYKFGFVRDHHVISLFFKMFLL